MVTVYMVAFSVICTILVGGLSVTAKRKPRSIEKAIDWNPVASLVPVGSINRLWIKNKSSVIPHGPCYSLIDGRLCYTVSGQNRVICGRNIDAEIVFDSGDPSISRIHCQFIEDDGKWMLEDLNSRNGTFLNGVKLNPNQPVAVKPGDVIGIGTAKLEVVEG